ncbi:DNL-type zinc finger protein isoform X1 [Grus americana]|uniref:DNL-type zinc finger protein isoform X1 n=1 Tax=Grus americana TaxID=9117 RepID=UPI0024084CC0|nr:DNL-type zinc finger protein isoform X1 [Grus americana]XP_054705245.1 DNL-type zinc finger protein isoform X1 [Grus americana]XP_054705246.1 DNL-type zinc finger protein isoform X1 [Grus americana]XP_054705247.1 DNL-type zinc finger protein isoform X1 [Grus americana]
MPEVPKGPAEHTALPGRQTMGVLAPCPAHTSWARSSKSLVGAGQCHQHRGLGFLLHDAAPRQQPVPSPASAPKQPVPTSGRGCAPPPRIGCQKYLPTWIWRQWLLPQLPAAPTGFKGSLGRAGGLPTKPQQPGGMQLSLPALAAEPHRKPVRWQLHDNALPGRSGIWLQRPPGHLPSICSGRATACPPAITATAMCQKHRLYHAWVKCPLQRERCPANQTAGALMSYPKGQTLFLHQISFYFTASVPTGCWSAFGPPLLFQAQLLADLPQHSKDSSSSRTAHSSFTQPSEAAGTALPAGRTRCPGAGGPRQVWHSRSSPGAAAQRWSGSGVWARSGTR